MFTEEELYSLLEEAFEEGYDSALEEVFEEDSSYDLEDEMDAYTEDTHKRTLRGTGMHMLPKGAYAAFKDSRKAHVKANKAWDDYEKDNDPWGSSADSKFRKWRKIYNKADKAADKFIYMNNDSKAAIEKSDRDFDARYDKPYKNNIARILNKRRIDASDPQYSRFSFVGRKR